MEGAHGSGVSARVSANDIGVEKMFSRPIENAARWDWKGPAMTDGLISLDSHRSDAGRRETEMRRCPANSRRPSAPALQPHLESLEDQMLAAPAQTRAEVMNTWRFLLDCYAKTPEAEDERIQKLIRRALVDMERLRECEERK